MSLNQLILPSMLTLGLLTCGSARAQSDDTPPAPQEVQESKPKSLDELLGLEEEEGQSRAADVAEREQEAELKRRLLQQQINESFAQAIDKMRLSAELLDEEFDAGLGTQRVQEEVLAKLDELIEAASQQEGGSAGSSSSSSRQQSQQQQPGRQQRQQQPNQGDQRNDSASDSQEGDPPPREDGAINTIIDETRTEWGHLPQRVREMLFQGSRDQYSSIYERLTAEYYRRLAESATGGGT